MLPAAPLLAAVRQAGGLITLRPAYMYGSGDRLRRAYFHAQRRGVLTVRAADQLAVQLLGVHPVAIWGEEFHRVKEGSAMREGA